MTCLPDDDRQQMVVFRDPRAVVVSTFFHKKSRARERKGKPFSKNIDEYVLEMLPTLCQWMVIRYIMFEAHLVHQSHVSEFTKQNWSLFNR